MASPQFAPDVFSRRRISLAAIAAAVSARSGSNSRLSTLDLLTSAGRSGVYLALHLSRCSTGMMDASTTVAITPGLLWHQRIDARESDSDIDALINRLKTRAKRFRQFTGGNA